MADTPPDDLLPAIDEPPAVWVDSHDVLENLPEEEIEAGELLRRSIDIDNDNEGSEPRALSNSLAVAARLKEALLDHGAGRIVSPYTGRVGGVSIELRSGRGTGGQFLARLHHHTASAKISSTRLTPALSICKFGRSDLQGPLCNGYGGGDFVYRIITLEWANHPGLGGPWRVSRGVIPKDNGRPYTWGTEWDWDGVSAWPDEYKEWMAVCDNGLMDFFGLAFEDQGEHKDPWAPLRKIDRVGISRSSSIARSRSVWGKYKDTGDWFDMATRQDLKELLDEQYRLIARGEINGKISAPHAQYALNTLRNRIDSVAGEQVNALAAIRAAISAVKSDTTLLGDDEAKILTTLAVIESQVLQLLPPKTP